ADQIKAQRLGELAKELVKLREHLILLETLDARLVADLAAMPAQRRAFEHMRADRIDEARLFLREGMRWQDGVPTELQEVTGTRGILATREKISLLELEQQALQETKDTWVADVERPYRYTGRSEQSQIDGR